ncbi:MAG: hypothetical protein QW273_01525 [Candidatus Pacearchaeota archaeon]
MSKKEIIQELLVIVFSIIILSISFTYPDIADGEKFNFYLTFLSLALIFNILIKKIVAHYYEIDIKTKFWSIYQYGFKTKSHFLYPVPMVWLPLAVSFITRGVFQWMPILESEERAEVARVAKRHDLYRFSQITEWNVGLIAFAGFLANIFLFFMLVFFGFKEGGLISLYYAIWSLLPLSNLDGNKILFASRKLWFLGAVIVLISLFYFSSLF